MTRFRSILCATALACMWGAGPGHAANITLQGGAIAGVNPGDTLIIPNTWRVEASEIVNGWAWSVQATGATIVGVNMNYAFGVPPAPPSTPGNVLWQAPSYGVIGGTLPGYTNDGSVAGTIAWATTSPFAGNGLDVIVGWVTVHVSSSVGSVTPFFGLGSGVFDGEEFVPTSLVGVSWANCTGTCGDGVVEGCEECDPGPDVPDDCCTASCQLESSGNVCRAAAGLCDQKEECDGYNPACPADELRVPGILCRQVNGACDVIERCSGSSVDCPPDGFEQAGTLCREAAGACDIEELCTGSGPACPNNALEPATTECRPALSVCDLAEFCSGISAVCPIDATEPDGEPCPDGDVCNGAEVCDAGSCLAAQPLECSDYNACTVDLCDAVTGCAYVPIPDCSYEAPGLSLQGQALLTLLLVIGGAILAVRWQARSV